MLIRRVIHNYFGDNADSSAMRRIQKRLEVLDCPVARIHRCVVGDVVPVVTQRRGIKRQQPQGVYAQLLQIIQFVGKSAKIAATVPVAIAERADMKLINNRVFVPEVSVLRRQLSTLLIRSLPIPSPGPIADLRRLIKLQPGQPKPEQSLQPQKASADRAYSKNMRRQ